MSQTQISAVIVAHNEEEKIEDCLKSLNFCDEIILVADKCTDKTVEISKKYTKNIITGSWKIEGARRNVALNAATKKWILEIDADERISPELSQEIIAKTQNCQEKCGFSIPIANYIAKRWVKYGWLRTLCVLQRQTLTHKGLKHYDEDKEVHPTFAKNFKIISLKNPITHLVDDNIADLLARFNRYTSWRANDMIAKNKIAGGVLKLLIKAKLRFYKSFIVKKGFKEGRLGFLIAILAALYPIISYIKAKENEDR